MTSSRTGKSATSPRPRPLRSIVSISTVLRRAVLARRRVLAAVFAGLAVLTGIGAVRPPPPPSDAIVVAARDLPAGTVLAARDLRLTELPPGALPDGRFASVEPVVGEMVAAPVRRGEPLTDVRLVQDSLLQGYPRGSVLSSIRIADASSLVGVRVGDTVNVLASDPAAQRPPRTLAVGIQVASMSRPQESIGSSDAMVLRVAVPEETALALADATVHESLAVVVAAPEDEDTPPSSAHAGW